MSITVKTPVYEGPLDLLLELIEKRKLLINDISLAAVTDEYIEQIGALGEMPVGETAEFVALAATLLLIKSRSLLPTLALSDDETKDIKELEYRLALYQIVKEAARALPTAASPLWEGSALEPQPLFLFDASVSAGSLRAAVQTLIDVFPAALALPKIGVKKIVSLEEMIEKLVARVSSELRLSFSQFAKGHEGAEAKHSVIVSFLALLELVKRGILTAHQSEHFGDITLEADSVSIPMYD